MVGIHHVPGISGGAGDTAQSEAHTSPMELVFYWGKGPYTSIVQRSGGRMLTGRASRQQSDSRRWERQQRYCRTRRGESEVGETHWPLPRAVRGPA